MSKNLKNENLPWNIVERAIYKEMLWLNNVIDVDYRGYSLNENFGLFNNDYVFYRMIAILIVSGKIDAKEINSNNLWFIQDNDVVSSGAKHRHGKDWHINTMNNIHEYFEKQNFEVTTEPTLYKGRADLGVFRKDAKDLYVEVGTTSMYKLCVNLHFMRDCVFLIVPTDNKIIQFEIL